MFQTVALRPTVYKTGVLTVPTENPLPWNTLIGSMHTPPGWCWVWPTNWKRKLIVPLAKAQNLLCQQAVRNFGCYLAICGKLNLRKLCLLHYSISFLEINTGLFSVSSSSDILRRQPNFEKQIFQFFNITYIHTYFSNVKKNWEIFSKLCGLVRIYEL